VFLFIYAYNVYTNAYVVDVADNNVRAHILIDNNNILYYVVVYITHSTCVIVALYLHNMVPLLFIIIRKYTKYLLHGLIAPVVYSLYMSYLLKSFLLLILLSRLATKHNCTNPHSDW
jgi:hypothetical protein